MHVTKAAAGFEGPSAMEHASSIGADYEPPEDAEAEKLNILLVDDRPEQLLALEATLENLAQNVVVARSGREALRHLLETEFAVILLDVQMPLLDGFETAALIRKRERCRHTPIIFLTGVERAEAQIFRGYELGAVDYVLKPVVPDVLRAKVSVFIELARKTRILEQQAELLRHNHRALVELGATRARLLADLEVSTALAASLDLQATLHRVAELAAARLADWCMLDVVDEDGQVCGSAASHANPEKVASVTALHRSLPLNPRMPSLALRAMRSGSPELVSEVTERELVSHWQATEHAEEIEECGLRSALSVPLIARGRTVGVMTLGSSRRWPKGGRTVLDLAQEFAQRAALAIDNARLYHTAEQAIKARDDFLCVASHELRTPLTPLRLQADALQRAARKAEDPRSRWGDRIAKIQRQCLRLERLVDHLLDVSRISAKQLSLDVGPMDLAATVREVVDRTKEEMGTSGPEIRVTAPDSLPGEWDRLRIEQVTTNVLSNAVKYGDGKPVEVRVEEVDDGQEGARLVVSDHGSGIPADQQDRIFGRFERAASTRHVGGLGLGLWIVNQIVRAHGGSIRVESAPGTGTTFLVELPRNVPRTLGRYP